MIGTPGRQQRGKSKRWWTFDAKVRSGALWTCCVGLHVIAYTVMYWFAWILGEQLLLIAIAVPLSQCSLLATWAATSRSDLALRFGVPLLGTACTWYLLTRLLPWGVGDPAPAGWAVAMGLQALTIVIVVVAYQRIVYAHRDSARSSLTFDLRSLILLTTAVALTFGFVQYGRLHWQWTTQVTEWEYFYVLPFVGLFNAMIALVILFALVRERWISRLATLLSGTILIAMTGYLLAMVVNWMAGAGSIDISDLLILAAAQACFVGVSTFLVSSARTSVDVLGEADTDFGVSNEHEHCPPKDAPTPHASERSDGTTPTSLGASADRG